MPSVNLNFRSPEALLAQVKRRDGRKLKSPGYVVKRDVQRWYTALEEALESVELEPVEAVLMIRLMATAKEPTEDFIGSLEFYIREHPVEGLGRSRHLLSRRVEGYDHITRWALVDAVERYEALIQREPGLTLGMALHRCGLHNHKVTSDELALLESTPAVTGAELTMFGDGS